MIQHNSTQIKQLVTANDDPSYQMSICSVLQIDIQYDRSSFIVISRLIRVESCQFGNIYNPPSQTLAEYFLSVLQINIQYDGSSFVVTSCSIRVHLCRFNNIFNPLSQTLVEYFHKLTSGMPFHVLKDGFSDLQYIQHHLANRLPVWRFVNCLWQFATVWVYWTTLYPLAGCVHYLQFCLLGFVSTFHHSTILSFRHSTIPTFRITILFR